MPFNILKYNIVDDEIEKAIFYYESISYDVGYRFEIEIEKTLDKLETEAAFYFNLEDEKHRRIPIEGFPYAFIYSIEENLVIVKILFPLREDPAKLWVLLGSI